MTTIERIATARQFAAATRYGRHALTGRQRFTPLYLAVRSAGQRWAASGRTGAHRASS